MTQGQFFKQSLTGLNSEFSFSKEIITFRQEKFKKKKTCTSFKKKKKKKKKIHNF